MKKKRMPPAVSAARTDNAPDTPPETSPRPASASPPPREFNDRSTLWLLEDPLNLRDLLRIHRPELTEHLDFTQAQRINRSFIPADLQKEEADLIFRVPFLFPSVEGETPLAVWIYLLLEQQTRPDPTMTLRLLSYMLELWELQKREWDDQNVPPAERRLTPVVPFVFYVGRRSWNTPLSFQAMFDVPPGFERFIPSWETLFLNLRKTPPETLTSFVNAMGWALRTLKSEQASSARFEQALKDAMAGMEGLTEEQKGQWKRVGIFLWQLTQYRRPPKDRALLTLLRELARQSKFFEKEEVEAMYTIADEMRDEGIAQGRQEGRQISLRAVLEQILVTKFGALPDAIQQTIAAADLDTLNDWVVAAAIAKTLAEVGIESAN